MSRQYTYRHHDGRRGSGPTAYAAMVAAVGEEEARAALDARRTGESVEGTVLATTPRDDDADDCPVLPALRRLAVARCESGDCTARATAYVSDGPRYCSEHDRLPVRP